MEENKYFIMLLESFTSSRFMLNKNNKYKIYIYYIYKFVYL